MNKFLTSLLFILLTLTACVPEKEALGENIIFSAMISAVHEGGISVSTTDNLSFKSASLNFADGAEIPADLTVGQAVIVEILPEIRESQPVQATAIKIILKKDEEIKSLYKKITSKEAKDLIDSETVTVLDVRTKSEFDEGHIDGAVLLPDTDISAKAAEILPDKSAKILIYCRSGRRSAASAKMLIEMGYTNVLDFGGINDWTYATVK